MVVGRVDNNNRQGTGSTISGTIRDRIGSSKPYITLRNEGRQLVMDLLGQSKRQVN